MKLREIIKTIKKNSQDLDEPLIMDELMSGIANAFELRNRLGKVYDWTSTRTSNALSNNWLPPELIKSYGLIGFHTALEKDVDAFFANYGKNILSNDLCMDLTSLYRKESAEMNSYKASSANKALIDCLDLAFRQLYEAQKSSSKKKPFKINKSLFVTVINAVISVSTKENTENKHSCSYSLDDKMEINDLKGALAIKMSESFFSYFDGIESTFDMMKKADLNIKSRFLLKMRGYYLDYLVSRGFDIGDKEKIKANSQDCLIWIEKKTLNDLGPNPKIDCFQEELSDYVFALIVYAFYRCRILIPVESENDN